MLLVFRWGPKHRKPFPPWVLNLTGENRTTGQRIQSIAFQLWRHSKGTKRKLQQQPNPKVHSPRSYNNRRPLSNILQVIQTKRDTNKTYFITPVSIQSYHLWRFLCAAAKADCSVRFQNFNLTERTKNTSDSGDSVRHKNEQRSNRSSRTNFDQWRSTRNHIECHCCLFEHTLGGTTDLIRGTKRSLSCTSRFFYAIWRPCTCCFAMAAATSTFCGKWGYRLYGSSTAICVRDLVVVSQR